jgi:putative SOS response-associated peptidase YedK
MCGRYVSPDDAAIEREFNLVHTEWKFPASYNVAPTQPVPVVRQVDGERRGSLLRWGLIPFFARGVPPKYSTINARVETIQTAASYKGPWTRAQRCLVVAGGFYEWQVQADGKTKIPFYIRVNDQDTFAFAGLWDSSKTETGERIESCTHITVPANNLVGDIHNTKRRMPAILEKADREAWLTGTPEEAWETLAPYPDDLMVAWPVGRRVNAPKNNDAALIDAVPPGDEIST